MRIAFTSRTLYTPTERLDDPVVIVEDGSIVGLAPRIDVNLPSNVEIVDFGNDVIAPGFVDIHIHGSAGYDVMQSNGDARVGFEQFLARHGVTTYYPTTVAAPLDFTECALEQLADAIESDANKNSVCNGRAQPLGIHLEGPFLSHARRGVHAAEELKLPTVELFDKLWQASRGNIRLMTIAPELEGALAVIAEAAKRGVCVSMGHSDASLSSAQEGVAAGARHATHTFNAMRRLDHRDPGILGEVLTNQSITADVIADGIHVDPTMVELLLKAKGHEKVALITDAIAATGMPDGHCRLGSLTVELKDGKCLLDGRLAGSVLTMDRAVRNVMEFTGANLQQSLRTATLNPAQIAGAQKKGVLAIGADADFVVLTDAGEVRTTVIKGVVVQ